MFYLCYLWLFIYTVVQCIFISDGGRCGRDRMVVEFSTTLIFNYLCNKCLSPLT